MSERRDATATESEARRRWTKSWLAMGTLVDIAIVTRPDAHAQESAGPSKETGPEQAPATVEQAWGHAMQAIHAVEMACSRFDDDSELVRLMLAPVGHPVSASPILFQALQFALEVAKWTEGRFDPSVGAGMERLGFNRHYLTGAAVSWSVPEGATYRDITLDAESQSVTLHRPVKLDLGAVAKGLGVDLAAQVLTTFDFEGFLVNAGGDLYAAGVDETGQPWSIAIRHPIRTQEAILHLHVTDAAVCTSGTYERPSKLQAGAHHLIDAHTGDSVHGMLSGSAIGPYTMMADALSTAAFLYPADEALTLLAEAGLEGVLITDHLDCKMTPGMEAYLR